MKKETAYTLANGIGVAANTVSFFFLHNVPVSIGLKTMSATGNIVAGNINRKLGDHAAKKTSFQLAAWDIGSAAIGTLGYTDVSAVANTLVGFCQFCFAKAGLRKPPYDDKIQLL
jgi:hypothetical protein